MGGEESRAIHPDVITLLEKAPSLEKWTDQLQMLGEFDQLHLLDGWDFTEEEKIAGFFAQLQVLDSNYPDGLGAYIINARKLLRDSAAGANPLGGFTPEVPTGCTLNFGTDAFIKAEEDGLARGGELAFVLVAGGLGERLGFSNIKIALPTEITTGKKYIQLYIEAILSIQRDAEVRQRRPVTIPLAIMTSGDTHARTVAMLEANRNFGMAPDQITILQQEKVASLDDADGHISRAANDKYCINTKPHGHGDVHFLLYSSGVAKKWRDEGKQYAVFFQDTNALVFRSLLAAVGVSSQFGYAANSMTGPREPKREMGAICRLRSNSGEIDDITTNVEYNMLEPMLKASGFPDGDTAGPDGLSPFPGNMNQLVFGLEDYCEALEATLGLVPEFVNPKYADAERKKFKKPTRLECMMQDFPRYFEASKVGFTTITGTGFAEKQGNDDLDRPISFYSPVKNNLIDAAAKLREGQVPGCASAGESDLYQTHCKTLLAIGCKVALPTHTTYGEGDSAITVPDWPHVTINPSHCLTVRHLRMLFPFPEKIHIAAGSTLVIDGPGSIVVQSLQLNGALTLRAEHPQSSIIIKNLVVENAGFEFVPVADDEEEEILKVRGYKLEKKDVHDYRMTAPGTLTIA